MTNNPLDGALINCNKNYQRITQERKPVVVKPKLKNVTPKDIENLSDEQRQALAWEEHPDNPKFDKEQQ